MKNGDMLRMMPDEGLASFFRRCPPDREKAVKVGGITIWIAKCRRKTIIDKCGIKRKMSCWECRMEWLKRERGET